MNCSEFVARFSDFRDGELDPEDRSVFEAHLEVCGSCSSYERVVNRGVRLLRDIPPPRLRDDFGDRLRHTIYSLEDRERSRRHRPHGPSGGGAMAVVAAAVLVVAVLWTPTLFDQTPSVDLPAIVVEPPVTVADGSTDVVRAQGWEGIQLRPSLVYDADLWTGANILLYEHSSLYQRSRDPELVRAGLH